MVKGFLTACFADAIGGRDPKIGRAGVKHHGEPLRRRAHAHNSIILRLGGDKVVSPTLSPRLLLLRSRWALAHGAAPP